MDFMKKNVAEKTLDLIKDHMIVGLGTGSTVSFFIESLIKRKEKGLFIKCVASSKASKEQAEKGGLEVLAEAIKIDIYVDGADEIDGDKNMIKGGGAAFLREKILANSSKEVVIIVDETKLVSSLGKKPLPIEVVPFFCNTTKVKLEGIGYFGEFRKNGSGGYLVSENNNYILDVKIKRDFKSVEEEHLKIINIPGVVETGLFFNLNPKVIVGKRNKKIEIL
jgi:ribose 5-phosphate isomerase A